MSFGIPVESLQQVTALLGTFPEIDQAVIFGSRAMGNYKPGSDVDIALFGTKVSPQIVIDVSARLNERLPLPYHFDVVAYPLLKEKKLLEHIDKVGKVFFKQEQPIEDK